MMKEFNAGLPRVNTDATRPPSTNFSPYLMSAAVCVLTFLAYARTLRYQFVHDDRGIILGNPAIHSWQAVPGYFTTQVWAGLGPSFLANEYRPIFLLWLRINDALFGLWPPGWHFASVLAHVIATYCVFLLAQKLLGDSSAAMFTELVFGLHPVHIEVVAWISAVSEALLVGFLVPAYLCWLRSREDGGPRTRWLATSLFLYTLALLTKETAVVLVLVLAASLLLDFPARLEPATCGFARMVWRILKNLRPFLMITGAYLIVRVAVLKGFSHPAAEISGVTVLLTWPSLLLFYLRLLVWPVGLSPFYGLQFVNHPSLWNPILPAIVLVSVGLGLWKWASHSRPAALATLWLICPILPVLNVQVFGNGNFAHNRYLYLPTAGFAMLVALALRRIGVRAQNLAAISSVQIGITIGLALLLMLAIDVEDRYYSTDIAFYSYAYSRMGNDDEVIGMDYANALAEHGDFDQAAQLYRKLIQSQPEMWTAYFNLGYMYYRQGNLDSAAQFLSKAAAGSPTNGGAVFYLGLTDFKLNRLDEAEANLRRAAALAPTTPNYHFALAIVLKVRGNSSGAMEEFQRELAINPANHAAAKQMKEMRSDTGAR
jgi:tetratricopeptide (TPR) repeat protein